MNGLTLIITISAIVVVFIIIAETIIAKRKNIKLYTLSDSIVNLSCGMLERTFNFFYAILFLIATNYIYENIAPYQIPVNVFTGIAAILIFDFLAYWHHRLSHEINFLWAAHIVHHQSEELNLTTVFRVSFFAVINRSAFFILMPIMGFDAYTILLCGVTLGLYQLFTHSRLIGKLGFLEIFMTTPSHHRVHHGRNEKYKDHNYGHIFIFWDKLFGTFTPEEEEPEYGTTAGFESGNAFNAQFFYWKNLFTRASRTKSWKNKVKVFVKGPAWTPDDVPHLPNEFKVDENGNRIHHQIKVDKELGAYILINILITFGIFIGMLKGIGNKNTTLIGVLENPYVLAVVAIILLSVFSLGQVIEQRKPSAYIDALRLAMLSLAAVFIFNDIAISSWLMPIMFTISGVMALWLIRLKKTNKMNVNAMN